MEAFGDSVALCEAAHADDRFKPLTYGASQLLKMTNEEITKLLKEHEEREASGKPFTDEEYESVDAEDKAKMDDYAEFCAYLAECEAMDKEELDDEGYFID